MTNATLLPTGGGYRQGVAGFSVREQRPSGIPPKSSARLVLHRLT